MIDGYIQLSHSETISLIEQAELGSRRRLSRCVDALRKQKSQMSNLGQWWHGIDGHIESQQADARRKESACADLRNAMFCASHHTGLVLLSIRTLTRLYDWADEPGENS